MWKRIKDDPPPTGVDVLVVRRYDNIVCAGKFKSGEKGKKTLHYNGVGDIYTMATAFDWWMLAPELLD